VQRDEGPCQDAPDDNQQVLQRWQGLVVNVLDVVAN
jgi:hypothetical protein